MAFLGESIQKLVWNHQLFTLKNMYIMSVFSSNDFYSSCFHDEWMEHKLLWHRNIHEDSHPQGHLLAEFVTNTTVSMHRNKNNHIHSLHQCIKLCVLLFLSYKCHRCGNWHMFISFTSSPTIIVMLFNIFVSQYMCSLHHNRAVNEKKYNWLCPISKALQQYQCSWHLRTTVTQVWCFLWCLHMYPWTIPVISQSSLINIWKMISS